MIADVDAPTVLTAAAPRARDLYVSPYCFEVSVACPLRDLSDLDIPGGFSRNLEVQGYVAFQKVRARSGSVRPSRSAIGFLPNSFVRVA